MQDHRDISTVIPVDHTGHAVPETAFAKVMAPYGGPWRLADADPEARGLDEIRRLFRFFISTQGRACGPSGPIYFDYVSNPNFNALAAVDGEYEFIGLFSGAIDQLYRLFFCFLSDPEVLVSVGAAAKEQGPSKVLESIRTNTPVTFVEHPIDDVRFRVAQNLALISNLLIVTHEVGHIVNCHPHFLRKRLTAHVYEELPTETLPAAPAAIRSALEWEADEYAAVVTHKLLAQNRRLLLSTDILSIDYVWSVALLMLLFLMHKNSGDRFDTAYPTHPSPYSRWIFMVERLLRQESRDTNWQSNDLGAGIADVLSFWRRHDLGVVEEGTWNTSLEEMPARYSAATELLSGINGELRALETARNERGAEQRHVHRAEAKRLLWEHLEKGPVERFR